jgi:magnesium-transporting ATPase (P-type)
LGTNAKTGIPSDESVKKLREEIGANIPVEKKLTTLWELIMECLSDTMLQILLAAAFCSMMIGVYKEGIEKGWMEGVVIFFAVFIIVSITAGNNYIKQQQFRKLQQKLDESKVEVVRGGAISHIDSKELVVGDVVLFRIGNIFGVDGIILSGSEIKIDESSLTGESVDVSKRNFEECKQALETDSEKDRISKTPFLLSGTKVSDGTGCMMVL